MGCCLCKVKENKILLEGMDQELKAIFLLVKDFHEGKEFLETWKPQRDLELMILGTNAQKTISRA